VDVLDRDPGVVLSHTASLTIDDRGNLLPFDARLGRFIYNPGGYEVPPDQVHLAEGDDAVARFTELLDETYFGMHMYGVIRREALAATALFRSYMPCERVLLSELALMGRFRTLEEPLYARRIHAKSACLRSKAINRRQRLQCLRLVAASATRSKFVSLKRRLPLRRAVPARKAVYQ
jgi:hypothetical protein